MGGNKRHGTSGPMAEGAGTPELAVSPFAVLQTQANHPTQALGNTHQALSVNKLFPEEAAHQGSHHQVALVDHQLISGPSSKCRIVLTVQSNRRVTHAFPCIDFLFYFNLFIYLFLYFLRAKLHREKIMIVQRFAIEFAFCFDH